MNYKKFELDIINKLLKYESSKINILNIQFLNSTVINREENSSGFFTKIQVNKNIDKINIENLVFGDLICKNNGKIFMGFLLYIENGYISLLEGYTFDDNFEEFNYDNCTLEFENLNNRKIPKELLI